MGFQHWCIFSSICNSGTGSFASPMWLALTVALAFNGTDLFVYQFLVVWVNGPPIERLLGLAPVILEVCMDQLLGFVFPPLALVRCWSRWQLSGEVLDHGIKFVPILELPKGMGPDHFGSPSCVEFLLMSWCTGWAACGCT